MTGLAFLAESGDESFVITEKGVLAVMSNVKLKELFTVEYRQAR